MAKITPESIAGLKALFQDNEKALGSNFSQLIDFFNDNKVTDNGDGTFTVGAITVDASKLYNLINNSSPNILPLDNEFTGKNTFDIAPINKANGKPYITADSVPPVDLSNYPTKDQLATKADTSAIDPSVMVKRLLAADDDVLALDPGTYYTWGVNPKNFPAKLVSWSTVVVEMVDNQPLDGKNVTITDVNVSQLVNTYSGKDSTGRWSGWRVPNSFTMASKTDVTTAINAATANMADTTKAANFTAGLQSGGANVATAADLKSVEDSAWRELTGSNDYLSYRFLYKIHPDSNYMDVSIGAEIKKDLDSKDKAFILDLAPIISGIYRIDSGLIFSNVPQADFATISNDGTKIYMSVGSDSYFAEGNTFSLSGNHDLFTQIYYTDLV